MAGNSIENRAKELLSELITNMGYELYDIEYLKEGKEYHLCIYIDSLNGISINDCEKVNDAINPVLDETDFIKEQYFLEVSSPGLERKLRTEEHFLKQIGNKIEVKLFSKLNNQNTYVGILKEYTNDYLIMDIGKEDVKIENSKISNAKTVFDWDNE